MDCVILKNQQYHYWLRIYESHIFHSFHSQVSLMAPKGAAIIKLMLLQYLLH